MNARSYGVRGVLAGAGFLLLGLLLPALFSEPAGGGLLARLGHAQAQPVMWLVDLAPPLLGLLGYLAGRREDALRALQASRRDGLRGTAGELSAGADGLLEDVAAFTAMTAQTAAAVRATSETMQRLEKAATMAALNAETVVGNAEASKKSSEDGLQEIRFSVAELGKLSEDVRALARSIQGIDGRMRNVFEVASVMNYLGDRFQSLADSAASEMSQVDAQGLPMGLRFIVAEMRRQGKDAKDGATLVQNLVNEMQKVMASTMAAAEDGVRRAERGAQIASRTRENVKRMSAALASSSRAAAEIAGIARQQSTGVEEVLASMNRVHLVTEDTAALTLRVAEGARRLRDLAGHLAARQVAASAAAPAGSRGTQAYLEPSGGA